MLTVVNPHIPIYFLAKTERLEWIFNVFNHELNKLLFCELAILHKRVNVFITHNRVIDIVFLIIACLNLLWLKVEDVIVIKIKVSKKNNRKCSVQRDVERVVSIAFLFKQLDLFYENFEPFTIKCLPLRLLKAIHSSYKLKYYFLGHYFDFHYTDFVVDIVVVHHRGSKLKCCQVIDLI